MARLALMGLLAAILVGGCSAASPAPTTPPTAAPTDAPAPTSAPTDAPTLAPTTAPTPAPTPKPPVPKAPAPPTAVKIEDRGSDPTSMGYDTDMTTTVTWKEAAPKGVTIRIYGVTACLPPKGQDPAPCLVKGTPLPASIRKLIASAPAARGRVSWTWPNWENIGGAVMAHGDTTYESIVVAAYNLDGTHSKFIIATTGEYCSGCTY